ncbi:MAG: hypothetical protein JWL68_715, partial [Actinomycetia bacterium]|nr:hypothetical protein [Actinomycetes bacterium]
GVIGCFADSAVAVQPRNGRRNRWVPGIARVNWPAAGPSAVLVGWGVAGAVGASRADPGRVLAPV